jgi:hypothetical protein
MSKIHKGFRQPVAQVMSPQVRSSKHMEGLAAFLSVNCLIFSDKLLLNLILFCTYAFLNIHP